MSRVHALLLTLLLAGCGGPREYAAPAPAGALQCALEEAEELGYQRMTGEPGEDYVRVSQRVDPPESLELSEREPPPGPEDVRPVPADPPLHNELLLREDGRTLRIEVLHSRDEEEIAAEEGARNADAHADMIITTCSG